MHLPDRQIPKNEHWTPPDINSLCIDEGAREEATRHGQCGDQDASPNKYSTPPDINLDGLVGRLCIGEGAREREEATHHGQCVDQDVKERDAHKHYKYLVVICSYVAQECINLLIAVDSDHGWDHHAIDDTSSSGEIAWLVVVGGSIGTTLSVSEDSSKIVDANILTPFLSLPILTITLTVMNPSIHHHRDNLHGSVDKPIDTIIHGAIDIDATDASIFVDEEGKKPDAPLLLEEVLKNAKLCLEVSTDNLNRVQAGWCTGRTNQQWTVDSKLGLIYNRYANSCLDAKDNYTPGSTVGLYGCNMLNGHQYWYIHAVGLGWQIINYDMCLDASQPIKPYAQMTIYPCNEDVKAQIWTQQFTGKKIWNGLTYQYFFLAPSSNNLMGGSPIEKPRPARKSKGKIS